MRKQQFIEVLGESSILSSAKRFRDYLDSISGCRKENENYNRACTIVCLIAYWINSDDGTCCPVSAEEIERAVSGLLEVLIEVNGYEVVRKNRFNYEKLGDLRLFGSMGTRTFSNIIRLLDVLYLEYVGKRFCPRCGRRVGSSDVVCGYCEHSLKQQ